MAENEKINTIIFKDEAHRKFFYNSLSKCRYKDVYHVALVYCLGISEDTRRNADRIYDFKSGYVKTECLHEGWQTSGSLHIVRLAYNLYCNGTPSVSDCEDLDDQLSECSRYTVEDVFCCGYAPVSYTHLAAFSMWGSPRPTRLPRRQVWPQPA